MTPVPVGPGMVEDSLEARFADARRRHDAGEFRPTLPLEVVVMGIRAHRATDLNFATARSCDLITWRESIEPWLEITGLKGFADGDVAIPDADEVELRAEFHAAHFQTLMATGDLYIGQLEEQLTHLRMGEQELAMDYCNRAQRILTEMRMAVVNYSTASYITHVIKGLPSGYNLMRQMLVMPGMWESLDEDTLTSHIIKDEAMQEAEQPTGLFPQANYIAPTKQSRQQGQRGKPRGAGSGVGRSTKDDDQAKSSRDKGEADVEEDVVNKGRRLLQWQGSRRRGDVMLDGRHGGADTSACGRSLEDFKADAATMHANPMVVLLDSGCSHHLMGTKEVFVDMAPIGDVKHVRGFNGAQQTVKGRGTVTLLKEAGQQILIPDVLYVPSMQANLLSAGQLQESGVKLQDDGDEMMLMSSASAGS
ncbi:unnamed protein product [Closterium sp. NIES-54]